MTETAPDHRAPTWSRCHLLVPTAPQLAGARDAEETTGVLQTLFALRRRADIAVHPRTSHLRCANAWRRRRDGHQLCIEYRRVSNGVGKGPFIGALGKG